MDNVEGVREHEEYEQRKKTFMELGERFLECEDREEALRLRDELARMTFGG
jgi:hypothetical protein